MFARYENRRDRTYVTHDAIKNTGKRVIHGTRHHYLRYTKLRVARSVLTASLVIHK